jgi:hypothetical protein
MASAIAFNFCSTVVADLARKVQLMPYCELNHFWRFQSSPLDVDGDDRGEKQHDQEADQFEHDQALALGKFAPR